MTTTFPFESMEQLLRIKNGEESAYTHAKKGCPQVTQLETRFLDFEKGGEYAIATNTGTSAILLTLLTLGTEIGKNIAASKQIFPGTRKQLSTLAKLGFHITFFDPASDTQIRKLGKPRIIFIESPSNPLNICYDIPKIRKAFPEAVIVIDNTIATPYGQSPLLHGADVTVYSTAKHISNKEALGGMICTAEIQLGHKIKEQREEQGLIISAHSAQATFAQVNTLGSRLEKQSTTAFKIATFLGMNNMIQEVHHSSLLTHPSHDIVRELLKNSGSIITFELADDVCPIEFIDRTGITIETSFGGVETTIIPFGILTPEDLREDLRVNERHIRLSIGMEDHAEILEKLKRGLTQ